MPTFDGTILSTDGRAFASTHDTSIVAPPGILRGTRPPSTRPRWLSLCQKTAYDSPFGVADQEWLSRAGDIDDAGLSKRLSQLMKTSTGNVFDDPSNPSGSLLHRRMFSVAAWEPNTFVSPNSSGLTSPFAYANLAADSGFPATAHIPSLLQGNKRINLNLPLPVSNSPDEPVRQKYVRELYQTMKLVLYPSAPPTAAQLAALGQYAVNVVDFRDPDATMTKFYNFDLVTTPPVVPATNTAQPTPASVKKAASPETNTTPVVQWGMEYNPIAINEVLSYQYTVMDNSETRSSPSSGCSSSW